MRLDHTPAANVQFMKAKTVNIYAWSARDGPDDILGVIVSNNFPITLSNVSWDCTPANGATCTAAGTGDIQDAVDIPAGASVNYTATGTAVVYAGNTATVSVPAGVTDSNPDNNSDDGN